MSNKEHTPTNDDALDEIATTLILARFRSNKETIRADLDQLIARVEAAAEQRGAVKALRENAGDIKLGNEYYEMLVEDELNARADMYADQEGDDEA
jgi:membrane protein implicated in regulation of membrane protease activity